MGCKNRIIKCKSKRMNYNKSTKNSIIRLISVNSKLRNISNRLIDWKGRMVK